MKILLILPTLEIGGAEKYTISKANNLVDKGHEVNICTLNDESGLEYTINENIKLIRLGNKNALSLKKVLKFNTILKNENFDVIHSHLYKSDLLNYISSYFSKKEQRITTEHSSSSKRKKFKIFGVVQRELYKRFDLVIAISESVKSHLEEWTGVSSSKIQTIYNGTSVNLRTDSDILAKYKEIQSRKIILGTVARLEWRKDLETSIQAIKDVREKTDLNIIYRIYGDGLERKKLENLIQKEYLTDIVFLEGYVNNIEEIIDDIDVHILPSIEEGFGVSVIETMARGIPNIVSNAGGLKEIFENESMNLKNNIFEKGNSSMLSEKIINLLSDEQKLIDISIESRNTVQNRFTIDSNVNNIFNALKERENMQ